MEEGGEAKEWKGLILFVFLQFLMCWNQILLDKKGAIFKTELQRKEGRMEKIPVKLNMMPFNSKIRRLCLRLNTELSPTWFSGT